LLSVIFQIGSHTFCPGQPWTTMVLFCSWDYRCASSDYRCASPHLACLLRYSLANFFVWASLKPWSSWPLSPK
jgi:hypothetical protein